MVPIVALAARTAFPAQFIAKPTERVISLDADAEPIGVNNRCSVCISGFLNDLVNPPTPSTKVTMGFNGNKTDNVMEGTIASFLSAHGMKGPTRSAWSMTLSTSIGTIFTSSVKSPNGIRRKGNEREVEIDKIDDGGSR